MGVQQNAAAARVVCIAACAARKFAQIPGVDIAGEITAKHNPFRGGAIVGDITRGRDIMRKLVLALGVVCATALTAGSASAFPGSQRTARRSRNAEHGAGSSVLPARRLLVSRPDQRLLPGRLGLRLDHLLSLGDALQPGRAHQQAPGPLIADGVRPPHLSANLTQVMMPVVEPANRRCRRWALILQPANYVPSP